MSEKNSSVRSFPHLLVLSFSVYLSYFHILNTPTTDPSMSRWQQIIPKVMSWVQILGLNPDFSFVDFLLINRFSFEKSQKRKKCSHLHCCFTPRAVCSAFVSRSVSRYQEKWGSYIILLFIITSKKLIVFLYTEDTILLGGNLSSGQEMCLVRKVGVI